MPNFEKFSILKFIQFWSDEGKFFKIPKHMLKFIAEIISSNVSIFII